MKCRIRSRGSVVRALCLISGRLPVLIQVVCFCPSGLCAPTLLKSSETKPALTSRCGGLHPRDNSYCWYSVLDWDYSVQRFINLMVKLVSGWVFFCQSPVASTWPYFFSVLLSACDVLFFLTFDCGKWYCVCGTCMLRLCCLKTKIRWSPFNAKLTRYYSSTYLVNTVHTSTYMHMLAYTSTYQYIPVHTE